MRCTLLYLEVPVPPEKLTAHYIHAYSQSYDKITCLIKFNVHL